MVKDMMETEALGGALFAYNALISGCTSSRSYDRALDYFDEMVRVGPRASNGQFPILCVFSFRGRTYVLA